ncbi:UNVERIFIED_CONTAM: hypothetical protein NCL1_03139 [Trichonephila clavipes]
MAAGTKGGTPRHRDCAGGRGDRRSGRVRLGGVAAGRAVRADPDLTAGAGGQLGWWQDRHQYRARQEPRRRLPPAEPCSGGYRRVAKPACPRFPVGLWRGGEIWPAGRLRLFRLAGDEWPRAGSR